MKNDYLYTCLKSCKQSTPHMWKDQIPFGCFSLVFSLSLRYSLLWDYWVLKMRINTRTTLPRRTSKEWLFLLACGRWDPSPCWVTTISCTVMCKIRPQHVWCCGRGLVWSVFSAVTCLQYKCTNDSVVMKKTNFRDQNLHLAIRYSILTVVVIQTELCHCDKSRRAFLVFAHWPDNSLHQSFHTRFSVCFAV